MTAAASVAVIMVGSYGLTKGFASVIDGVRVALSLTSAPSEGTFTTSVGERTVVTLRDGSILTLNTNSEVRVLYTDQERKIVLTRGQGLFEVAKGQGRPFVVYAGDRRIVATGTAFEVRLDKATVEVTLVEGHLLVDTTNSAHLGVAGSRTELHAGERLVAKAGSGVSISPANVDLITSWATGKLVFLNTRLADAVDEVNRYTRTPVILSDRALGELRINGVFRAGWPGDFAHGVAQLYPVSVTYQANGQIWIAQTANR
jgi:transmembrane sensor